MEKNLKINIFAIKDNVVTFVSNLWEKGLELLKIRFSRIRGNTTHIQSKDYISKYDLNYQDAVIKLEDIESRFLPRAEAYFMGRLLDAESCSEKIRLEITGKYEEVLGTPYIRWTEEFPESTPYFSHLGEYINRYLCEKGYVEKKEMTSRDKFRRWMLDAGEESAMQVFCEIKKKATGIAERGHSL